MLKLVLKRKMPKRWAGEDQFVSKMGSLHRIAMMELFIQGFDWHNLSSRVQKKH